MTVLELHLRKRFSHHMLSNCFLEALICTYGFAFLYNWHASRSSRVHCIVGTQILSA